MRVNDTLFVDDRFPRSAEMLDRAGLTVHPLCVRETAKLDAGLSCMSLRWSAA